MSIPFIDLKSQYLNHKTEIDKVIQNVLDHGQYIMGPEVKKLESALSEYIGTKHCLTCSSGTDALLLALMTKKLKSKDVVLTSPFTFFASAESISLAGATPAFVDIDKNTYNMDPSAIEATIEKVKRQNLNPVGIMPVDIFGIAADYDLINHIARKHNLFVIEDAAQAFGAKYNNQKACGLAELAATSFYPAKPLGCYGDGGAVFTDNTDLYDQLVSLRVHGQSISGDKYNNIQIGLNARMDTIQAAILLVKLEHYDTELKLRNSVAEQYNYYLKDFVKVPFIPEQQSSVWAQYSIMVPDRAKVVNALQNKNIPTAIFYPLPVHLSGAYKHLYYQSGDFPVCEEVSKHIISLPMHPYLSETQIKETCETLISAL